MPNILIKRILVFVLLSLIIVSCFTPNIFGITDTGNIQYPFEKVFVDISSFEGWNKTFGGSNSEGGVSVFQTNDGEYLLMGNTLSFGDGESDVWLIKTDTNGNEIWNKTYGGEGYDSAYSMDRTIGDGIVIIGETNSYGSGPTDILLIKTDENGNELWIKTFGGSELDWGFSVKQTNDEGFILVGQTWSWSVCEDLADVWLIKTDRDGNEIWNRTFGGINGDGGFCVQQTYDDGYIIVGDTNSYGEGWTDAWLIKTDENGNEIWNMTYSVFENDVGWHGQQTNDGGYIITGFTGESDDIYGDVLLIKTDENGNELWIKTYGGDKGETSYFVQQTDDGGYIIIGETYSHGSGKYDSDIWLIKTNSNGDVVWEKTFGGMKNEAGHAVRQTMDGDYILIGDTFSFGSGVNDIWLIRVAELENCPPNSPSISGPINGNIMEVYQYEIIADDPDGDGLYYFIEFEDREGYWTEDSYPSGETITRSWRWGRSGTYDIKVKAKDINGAESDWATLEVTMPKNKAMDTPFFRFLELHPHMFSMLRQLLGL